MTTLSSKLGGGERSSSPDVRQRGDEPRPGPPRPSHDRREEGDARLCAILSSSTAAPKLPAKAGFEQQPKYFDNPKVLALNLGSTQVGEGQRRGAPQRPRQVPRDCRRGGNIIYDKLEKCVASGAKVILSCLAIDPPRSISPIAGVCVGRVAEEDHPRHQSDRHEVQTTVNDVTP